MNSAFAGDTISGQCPAAVEKKANLALEIVRKRRENR